MSQLKGENIKQGMNPPKKNHGYFSSPTFAKDKAMQRGLSCDTNDRKRIETQDRRSLNLSREIQVSFKIKKT
jgi:hypothetical protein